MMEFSRIRSGRIYLRSRVLEVIGSRNEVPVFKSFWNKKKELKNSLVGLEFDEDLQITYMRLTNSRTNKLIIRFVCSIV